MFDPRLTSGGIEEDISALSEINLGDDGVNEFVSSLVLKYIQAYFGAGDIGEGLDSLAQRLDRGGGGFALLNEPINESYTLECLGCISQTSAILKEIIFHDGYESGGEFKSCDLGAGTGILSLGAYISGLRKGLQKGKIYLMDHEETSLRKGKEILQALVGPSFEVHSILGNIIKAETLAKIGEEKIQFWISETIGMMTPKFRINPQTGKVMMNKDDIDYYKQTRTIDPFPEVVKNIVTHNPNLEQDIKSGTVALFPDYVNDLYKPAKWNSTLELTTSGNGRQRLGDVGQEFSYIVAFDERRRWTNM